MNVRRRTSPAEVMVNFKDDIKTITEEILNSDGVIAVTYKDLDKREIGINIMSTMNGISEKVVKDGMLHMIVAMVIAMEADNAKSKSDNN